MREADGDTAPWNVADHDTRGRRDINQLVWRYVKTARDFRDFREKMTLVLEVEGWPGVSWEGVRGLLRQRKEHEQSREGRTARLAGTGGGRVPPRPSRKEEIPAASPRALQDSQHASPAADH